MDELALAVIANGRRRARAQPIALKFETESVLKAADYGLKVRLVHASRGSDLASVSVCWRSRSGLTRPRLALPRACAIVPAC